MTPFHCPNVAALNLAYNLSRVCPALPAMPALKLPPIVITLSNFHHPCLS